MHEDAIGFDKYFSLTTNWVCWFFFLFVRILYFLFIVGITWEQPFQLNMYEQKKLSLKMVIAVNEKTSLNEVFWCFIFLPLFAAIYLSMCEWHFVCICCVCVENTIIAPVYLSLSLSRSLTPASSKWSCTTFYSVHLMWNLSNKISLTRCTIRWLNRNVMPENYILSPYER